MDILYDRSDTIRESYHDVQFTMLLTLGLVIMVIFLFLRNVSATVIPSLALPFSIIGTFAVMYLLDYSLDNLSMMALILSIGFVVDDAIVMLENIVRHMEMGEKPLTASLNGSREIGFTIVSMTLSLAAVFIPVLFMGGMLGRLFREFAVTICVAILISGVVSVTLTPMLCSRFLRVAARAQRRPGSTASPSRFFDGMLRVYDRTLQVVLRHRPATMADLRRWCWSPTGVHVRQDPEGLHPRPGHRPDCGHHRSRAGHLVLPDGRVSAARSPRSSRTDPNVEGADVASVRRRRGATLGGPNFGAAGGPPEAARRAQGAGRPRSSRSCGPSSPSFPACDVYLQNPPTIRIGGQVTKSLYQFSMQSPEQGGAVRRRRASSSKR